MIILYPGMSILINCVSRLTKSNVFDKIIDVTNV